MAVTPKPRKIVIRIGRVSIDGKAGDAATTGATLRSELARLVAANGVPASASSATRLDGGVLHAATPAGRGREAASRILGSLK